MVLLTARVVQILVMRQESTDTAMKAYSKIDNK